jgi:hypothetical protein
MTNLKIRIAITVVMTSFLLSGCSQPASEPVQTESKSETLSRTEFTDRVENFFEYELLIAGKPSPFLIHLTDLSDGSPVERAEVVLTVRAKGASEEAAQTVARVGKVTGIYVAELNIQRPGDYDVEFHIKNDKLDERILSSDFRVE